MPFYIAGNATNTETDVDAEVWAATHQGYTISDPLNPYQTWASVDNGEAFWSMGQSGAANKHGAYIGLKNDYRIRIDEYGISGYNPDNSSWTGLMGGGGEAIPDHAELIPPMHFLGRDGFIDNTAWYGACLSVVFSDINAAIVSTYFVVEGGSFKLRLIHSGDGANNGKTADGWLYINYSIQGETESWDIGPQGFNIPLSNTTKVDWYDSASFTVADNSKVALYWAKNGNAEGAAGTMYVYGISLVRQ
jgi:hypothetical protein